LYGPDSTLLPFGWLLYIRDQFCQPAAVVHAGQRVNEPVVYLLGDLRSPVQIRDSLAHVAPLKIVGGASFFGPVSPKDANDLQWRDMRQKIADLHRRAE